MKVSQIMVEPVTIDKDQRLSYALELLEKKNVERLVVSANGVVKGILTYADIADRWDFIKCRGCGFFICRNCAVDSK